MSLPTFKITGLILSFLCISSLTLAQCDEIIKDVRKNIDTTNLDRDYEIAVNLLLYAQDVCPDSEKELVRDLFKTTFQLIQSEKERAIRQAKISEYRRLLNLASQEVEKKNQSNAVALILEAHSIGLPSDSELYGSLINLFQNSINGENTYLK